MSMYKDRFLLPFVEHAALAHLERGTCKTEILHLSTDSLQRMRPDTEPWDHRATQDIFM